MDRSRRDRVFGARADLSSRVVRRRVVRHVRRTDKSLRFAVCISSARNVAVWINDLRAACVFMARVDRGARASRRRGVGLRGLTDAAGSRPVASPMSRAEGIATDPADRNLTFGAAARREYGHKHDTSVRIGGRRRVR
jgi:hypothetical protein